MHQNLGILKQYYALFFRYSRRNRFQTQKSFEPGEPHFRESRFGVIPVVRAVQEHCHDPRARLAMSLNLCETKA